MALVLSGQLSGAEALAADGIVLADRSEGRPLRILLVNLMPNRAATETQVARLLSNSALDVTLDLYAPAALRPEGELPGRVAARYLTIDEVTAATYDGLIISGSPLETVAFEETPCWGEIARLYAWSEASVGASLHICWGAMSGLYYFYGIDKKPVSPKLSGVYPLRIVKPEAPIVRGFDDGFLLPQSRHAAEDETAIQRAAEKGLAVVAQGETAGSALLASADGRRVFLTGHPEYDRETLDGEYRRDIANGLVVNPPVNLYEDDDPAKRPVMTWHGAASLLFQNWLLYAVKPRAR